MLATSVVGTSVVPIETPSRLPTWLPVPKVSAWVSFTAESTRMPGGRPQALACSGRSSPTIASGATSSGSFSRSTPDASIISSHQPPALPRRLSVRSSGKSVQTLAVTRPARRAVR